MGKFDFQVDSAFLKRLGKLADVDRIAPLMIDESIPNLESSVQAEASRHVVTGAMASSIKKTKTNKLKSGSYYACVRPTGTDSKGVRNMEKMVYAEFGTSKQSPTPMLTKAIKDSEQPVLKKMQEVFEREVSK